MHKSTCVTQRAKLDARATRNAQQTAHTEEASGKTLLRLEAQSKPFARSDGIDPVPKERGEVREMGGAPRNLAPRNHFLVQIVKPSGRHCADGHSTSRVFTEDQLIVVECRPPLGALPFL